MASTEILEFLRLEFDNLLSQKECVNLHLCNFMARCATKLRELGGEDWQSWELGKNSLLVFFFILFALKP